MKRMPRLITSALLAWLPLSGAHAAELDARLTWSGRVTLAMPVHGVLSQIHVRAGERVSHGTALAEIDAQPFQAGVAEAEAEQERLDHDLRDARRELARVRELYARTISPASELEAAQLRHDRALAGVAGAQARLQRARHQLGQARLRAPFDAIVIDRMAEPGMVVGLACETTPLFIVARADELLAHAVLDAAQRTRIAPGVSVQLRVGGHDLRGQVRDIVAQDDGGYRVTVAVARTDGLHPGLAARLRLP